MKTKTNVILSVMMILGMLLSACGGSEAEPTPTLSKEAIETNAVGTFSAGLTQTALAAPTGTPTLTPTTTPLPTIALLNITPFATIGNASPTSSCYQMTFMSDVTIPDNTPVKAGQTFTKTWKVVNSGSCAWDAGFKLAFTGGDAMSGASYTLPASVPANGTVDVSVAMTAPSKTGSVRGNWRMTTAAGQYFGDEIYVMVMIGNGSAATETVTPGGPTLTETSTPTETPTPTP